MNASNKLTLEQCCSITLAKLRTISPKPLDKKSPGPRLTARQNDASFPHATIHAKPCAHLSSGARCVKVPVIYPRAS